MLIWMRATVEPTIAAHHTDVAAHGRAQNVVAVVEPLQAAERVAVVTPFGRGVGICFVDPCFALGQAAGKKFGEIFKL